MGCNIFIAVGRFLGGSRIGQLFFSIAIAALFSGLAYAAWHERDLAATALTVGLLVYGSKLAWRALPISSVTRAFWDCDPEIAEGCPAYAYRGCLWGGIGIVITNYWSADSAKATGPHSLITAAIFIAIGAISYIATYRFCRHEQNTSPRASAGRRDA